MIHPEDLQNRVVRQAPLNRQAEPPQTIEEAAVAEAEHRSTPNEPCPPLQPADVEHGERIGGTPDRGNE